MKYILFIRCLFITFLITLFASCQDTPPNLEKVLKLAGDNRKELEKVIAHYQEPRDSLKLKAAYFLITKIMPYESYNAIEDKRIYTLFKSLKDSLAPFSRKENEGNYVVRDKIIKGVLDQYELKNGKLSNTGTQLKGDLQTIPASFLIENIDYAFEAWNLPWSKKYNFEQFCEYILPYRSGKEHPNDWRKYFFNELKYYRDSIGNETDAVAVATRLKMLMRKRNFVGVKAFYRVPYLLTGPQMCEYAIYGSCVSLSNIVTESLRAIGIPTTEVLMNKFGNEGSDHLVNAVLDNKGKWYYFDGLGQKPGDLSFKENLTKVYRRSSIDEESLTKESIEAIKTTDLLGWKDITKEVMTVFNIILPSSPSIKKDKVVYLCIFDAKVSSTWVPIDWTIVNSSKSKIIFKNIGGKEVVYLAMTMDVNNELKPIYLPFILKSDGTVVCITPKREKTTIAIKRKYKPVLHLEEIAKNLVGGKFEGSNSPSFEKAKTLYIINEVNDISEVMVDIKPTAYRYYRFIYPSIEGDCKYDMAELGFGGKKNGLFVNAKGNMITSKRISRKVTDVLFDSDLLSYSSIFKKEGVLQSLTDKEYTFNLAEKVWVGIDLGAPKLIETLYYCPRNDKNGIYPGMKYELFYWNNAWLSLGVKIAKNNTLHYKNAPKNALFLLKNHTEGNEERIFTYVNDEQVWW